jgi:ATP/ADP translocase
MRTLTASNGHNATSAMISADADPAILIKSRYLCAVSGVNALAYSIQSNIHQMSVESTVKSSAWRIRCCHGAALCGKYHA